MQTVAKSNPAIISSVKNLILETDADLNVVTASAYIHQLLTTESTLPSSFSFSNIFVDDDRDHVKNAFLAIRHHLAPATFSATLLTFSGTLLFTQWIISPVMTNDGIPVIKGYSCTGCEIKQNTVIENSGKDNVSNSVFQNSPHITFIVDENCAIRNISPGIKNLFEGGNNTWENHIAFDYLFEEDLQKGREAFSRILQNSGHAIQLDLRVKKPGGDTDEFIWMEFRGENKLNDPAIKGIVISLRDISERMRSEQKLSNYSNQITNILNSITDGFVALDKNFTVRLWNKVAEQIVGMRNKEVLGKSLWNIFNDFHGTALYGAINKAIEDKSSVGFEQYIDMLDRWFDASAYPYENGVFIYFKDITQRKRQDMLLALEKEVLEMNTSKNASLKNTVDHFLLGLEKINKGLFGSVLLLDDDRLHIRHLSSPSLPAAYSAAVDGVEIGPNHGSYTGKKIIVGDIATDPLWEGIREIPLSFKLQACWSIPIVNSKAQVIASFACYYNKPTLPSADEMSLFERAANLLQIIIDNKKSEDKIRLINERFLWATKATNEAIWDWDVKSNMLYWGEGFTHLFGYKTGYKTNTIEFWEAHIHPDDKDRVLKGIEEFMLEKKQGRWKDEYRFKKADGNYALVADKGFLIYDDEGNMSRMIGATEDITERKQLERKLLDQQIAKQKLIAQAVVDAQEKERADIGKELHDNVNQILSTAKLFLEAAKTDKQERLPLIAKSAEHIHNAINEIRSISKALVPSSINDIGLIESITDLVHNISSSKTIKVSFNEGGKIEDKINSQQKLTIFRIIQEQANNVLKHAQAKHLIIYLVSDKDHVYLEVSDDGKGFDPNHINNKKGVGLSNIVSRAELFNGKVSIQSSPGNGCKLEVKIPIKIS